MVTVELPSSLTTPPSAFSSLASEKVLSKRVAIPS